MTTKKTTTAPKKETVAKAVEAVQGKEEAVKAAPAKAEKAPVKKAAPKKAAAKTAKAEKAEVSQNVYIQFAGKEILVSGLQEQVKNAWVEQGHRAASVKSVDLYVKPEEHAAYYVINGKETGRIEL